MKRHNRIIGLVLACLLLLGSLTASVFSVSADSTDTPLTEDHLPEGATPYDGVPSTSLAGSGTEEDPYLIADTADFVYFYESMAATATAGQVFRMTGDVYWNAKTSKTKYAVSSQNFDGILDGNGHTVYNAFYTGWGSQTVFGTVTGTIRNLTFDGTSLTASNGSVGGVCITLKGGLVDNVRMKDADIGGQHIGGIAKNIASGATVSNCTVEGTLHYTGSAANGSLGGIVNSIATGESGTIRNCINRAFLSGTKTATFGGIIACSATNNNAIEALTIKDCENYGELVATQANAIMGGILGNAYRIKNLLIENNTNYGALTGTGNVGGILGYAKWGMSNTGTDIVVRGCCNKGAIISSGTCVGGIVGNVDDVKRDTQIMGCANYADLTAVDNVGGIIGRNNSGEWQDQKVVIVNSAVYGNVTATGNYAGILAGFHVATYASGAISATNCVLTGTVSANEGAGGILGYIGYRQAKGATSNLKLINTFVDVTVKVPTGANAGTLIGGAQSGITGLTLDTTDSGVSVKVFEGDSAVGAPAAYYTYPADGALSAQTAELPALADGAMTDGTVKNRLNTYATANSLGAWTQGTTAPVLMAFYEWPAVFTNKSALSHAYTGEAVAAETKAMRTDVARVDVLYYLRSDLSAPLSGAPANAGEYRVTLRAYDAAGNELDAGNDFSYDFEITKAKTEIVPVLSGLNKNDDGTYSVEYKGREIALIAYLRNSVTGKRINAAVSAAVTLDGNPATMKNPGVYVITYAYGGDDNHEAAETLTLTVEVTKTAVSYPENIWTVNGTDALPADAGLPYNGLEQTLRLLGVDESIFTVDYVNNAATNAGGAMTATATVSLRADIADYYELTGTAPTYEWTWTVTKAAVRVVILRTPGDLSSAVELTDCEYPGETVTYYVVFADEAGNIAFTPENNEIVVSGAGAVERTFTWEGNTNYEAADETITFRVTPKKLGENGGSHADLNRTYDGNKSTFRPDFGTAPTGTTWSADYETLLERKNGDTYENADEALRGGEYRVTFTAVTEDGNYTASFTVTFTIARAAATITPPATGWTMAGEIFTITYDGKEYSFNATTDSDGELTVTYDCDGKTNLPKVAGTYTVTVTVAASDNYEAASATYTVRVDKMVIPAIPEGTELWDYAGAFTYDGQEKRVAVKAAFLAQYGLYLDYRYENAAGTAAGDYTARVIFSLVDTKNTRFAESDGTEVTRALGWKVNKLILSVAGVTLPDASGIYNGSAVTTEVGLPDALKGMVNVRYEWTLNGKTYTGDAVNAGTYTVTAILTPKDASTEFTGGEAEYRTAAATVTIRKNAATIGMTGDRDFDRTYDGTTTDPLANVQLTGSDGTVFDVADYLTVTLTKDGKTVTAIRDAGTYRITISIRENDNVTSVSAAAASLTRTVTVKRATYDVDGKITVVGDTTYVEGKTADITLRVDVKGADDVAVRVDESRLPKLPKTPGTHTVTYYLKGSDNYEALEAFTVTVTVKRATVKDSRKWDVRVVFDKGADPDIRLEVVENAVDKDVKNLLDDAALGKSINHPAIRQLYRYTFKDKDGKTLKYSDLGELSVVITLPAKYRGYTKEALFDELSVICVSYNKGIAGKMDVEDSKQIVYDAKAGTLTLKVTSPDVAYGYVTEASPVASYVTIGIGGVALIAVIVLAVVRAVGASRCTCPEGPDTPDGTDAGYGEGTEDTDAAGGTDGAPDESDTSAPADDADVMPLPDEMPVPDEDTPRPAEE